MEACGQVRQVIERVLLGRRVACRLYWGRGGPNSLFRRMRNVGVSQRGRERKRINIEKKDDLTIIYHTGLKGSYEAANYAYVYDD